MKKVILTSLAAAFALASCAPKPDVVIDGTVANIADGTKIYLWIDEQNPKDTTVVADGKFRIPINFGYPNRMLLKVEGVKKTFPFFSETGTIKAHLDGETAHFTGTETNDAWNNFNAAAAEVKSYDEQMGLVHKTIADNPATVLASYLTMMTAHAFTTPAQMDSALNVISGAPANTFINKLNERRDLLAATAVGAVAPDFTQERPDGTTFTLSSLRGKLVLVDFWASWCGPCRRENPNVVAMYNRMAKAGAAFEIVGVSLDNDRAAWLKAIEDDKLTWIHVSDLKGWQNAVAQQYAVRSIPHTVLVGADGVIVAKNLRGAALEAKVADILGVK